MTIMFVRHQVQDYAAWRKVYDEFGPTQARLGVTGHAVYRAADNPNDITVTHEFASLEAAQAFAASPELHGAMAGAGVAGEPSIWFAQTA
ncbi:MAG: antibiotic biosynthesis monooxygenase [Dehalococcoidia bacterium]